ncbi:hypothetical protein [Candidatus Clostridium radicumherbarum]|uniref:DUF4830 domain-containing protein n=1 Tax=Candidatus Clostridium radicumherbarum TaxID=3381662 RepID=A0ABW8TUZ5_9CLOT
MRGIIKGKRLKIKLLATLLIAAVLSLTGYELWLHYPAVTPEVAVVKYCKAKSLTLSQQNFKVKKTEIIDPVYGNQFIVSGVTGEFGSDLPFFYLKNNANGWKVISAGTGP